ncbi:MAG: hypothetical protein OEZ43_07025 [Gammaproteobacteria bacterium]|nr:hypothetical protein [Gammaproteobacteria bacterium]
MFASLHLRTLLLSRPHDEEFQGEDTQYRYALFAGRRLVSNGKAPFNALRDLKFDEIRIAFESPQQSYFDVFNTRKGNKKSENVFVRKAVEQESVFDEKFEFRTKLISSNNLENTVAVVAFDVHDIGALLENTLYEQYSHGLFAPRESAIAALVSRGTDEPVIACWSDDTTVIGIVVRNGNIYSRKIRTTGNDAFDAGFDGIEDINSINELMQMTESLRTDGKRLFNDDDLPIIWLGKTVETLANAVNQDESENYAEYLSRDERLKTDIVHKLNLGIHSSIEEIFVWPELYGLIFCKPHHDFSPVDYKHVAIAHRMARPLFNSSVALASVFVLFGSLINLYANSVTSDVDAKTATVAANLKQVQQAWPTTIAENNIKTRLKEERERLDELRLDNFVSWISSQTPNGIAITKLKISPKHKSKTRNTKAKTPKIPGQYVVNLVAVSEGDYERAHKAFVRFVSQLNKRTKLESPLMSFEPMETTSGKATFTTDLDVNAREFIGG